MNAVFERYQNTLSEIPPPGGGCHPALLSVANLGVLAGLDADTIFQNIRAHISPGQRRIPDREIHDAIRKALADLKGGSFIPRPRPEPVVKDGKAALQRIINQATITTEVDLWECSPLRLWDKPQDDPARLLEMLYEPTDLLWIGERHDAGIPGKTIRFSADWITYFRNGGQTAPHIIPNPLTGQEGITRDGKPSFRCDATVKTFLFCLAEFDTLSREDQLRFWCAVKLPLVCLIDSGGKSIHAWLQVSKLATVTTSEQWQLEIKNRLYDRILTPLGVDGACSNPARLSRLPGHYRQEKCAWQRLLWLSPEGRSI